MIRLKVTLHKGKFNKYIYLEGDHEKIDVIKLCVIFIQP